MQSVSQSRHSSRVRPAFNTSEGDLQNIILHILQDAEEKVEEIDVKTEEEFLQERNKEILISAKKIDRDYNEKEIRAERSNLVYESKINNLGRLDVLNSKFFHVEDTVNRARKRFANKDHKSHLEAYQDILRALIMQGICKLLEPLVFVRTRPEDKTIVRGLLEQIEKDYEEATGLPVKMYMDEEGHLPEESEGGVVLCSQDNSVSLDNTLASRLDIIFQQVLPQINQMLYGAQRYVPTTKKFPSYLPTVSLVQTRMENQLLKDNINIDKYSIGRLSIDEHTRPFQAFEGTDEDSISTGSLFLADGKK